MEIECVTTCLSNALHGTANAQDSFMDALDNLGYSGFYSGLITKVGYILTTFADNDTGFFSGNKCAQSECIVSGLLSVG